MHYKTILHFIVEGTEVLKMDITGANKGKATGIAKDTLKGNPRLFKGKVTDVSIEYVYSVPDGCGCVDFEFDIERVGEFKG